MKQVPVSSATKFSWQLRAGSDFELRRFTGYISPQNTITFTLEDSSDRPKPGARWTDVYVLDVWGDVLARADLPKQPH